VRLKNKGAKKRAGRKQEQYQAPVVEKPQTGYEVANAEIYANHVEALNASIRQLNTAFRRKINT